MEYVRSRIRDRFFSPVFLFLFLKADINERTVMSDQLSSERKKSSFYVRLSFSLCFPYIWFRVLTKSNAMSFKKMNSCAVLRTA